MWRGQDPRIRCGASRLQCVGCRDQSAVKLRAEGGDDASIADALSGDAHLTRFGIGHFDYVRGGSFASRPKDATSGWRWGYEPRQKVYDVGFRVLIEE